MQHLCSSHAVFSALQHAAQNSLWYKVPKDASGSVDLAIYLFGLSNVFDENLYTGDTGDSGPIIKKVVSKVNLWNELGSLILKCYLDENQSKLKMSCNFAEVILNDLLITVWH
ncbi:MAG: hypothetical protein DSY43_02695 [Gammaproteobacteria bacterium]|nr:MAG: hypothetical protein DSY43_02695 [Gammaproteobacteria bacterium]